MPGFGNPATIVPADIRPEALRPTLSSGLLLSFHYYSVFYNKYTTLLKHLQG